MRHLLPFTLAIVVALSAAGCAGPNLQGYRIVRDSDPSATDARCRLLADPRNTVRRYCVNAAAWKQYDAWAASAGVTCREIPGPGKKQLQDACLTAGLWRRFENGRVSAAAPGWDGGTLGGSNTAASALPPVALPQPYASSYGPFPSGGAIGQTFK